MQRTITELKLNVNLTCFHDNNKTGNYSGGFPIENLYNSSIGENTAKRVFAKQFDRSSRILKIKLYDNKDPISLDGVYRICIRGTKPDSTQFFNTCSVDDGFIIAELTEQMLAAGGTVMADIVLFESENDSPILSSETFYIDVFPAYFNDNQVISDSEYSAILEALAKAPNKEGIWRGFADYFNSLENIPEEAIEEFDSVNLEIMTLDCIIKKIFIINKIITDSQPKGVSDYSELNNKPSINGVTLDGNKTSQELGIVIPNNSGDDKNYIHTQSQSSNTWVIAHNLGKYPSVTVINSAGDEVVGDVKYDSQNQVTVTFKGAFKGTAIFN